MSEELIDRLTSLKIGQTPYIRDTIDEAMDAIRNFPSYPPGCAELALEVERLRERIGKLETGEIQTDYLATLESQNRQLRSKIESDDAWNREYIGQLTTEKAALEGEIERLTERLHER